MDFQLFNNEFVEDDYAYAAQDIDNENVAVEGDEGQRCGICMDVVVDRGVLDCCQHWFCFSCIDNWASITNLCPLCQKEFQLITCVPVFDTIGGVQPDDGPYSRDEDTDEWSVEGNNNTLSFPSYYIDENAVSCLDGDNCKIRGQSANFEEDPDLDTSIACDSCDLWYHAICVGFDTNASCEDSWLCPRCLVDPTSEKSKLGSSNHYGPESSSNGHLVDATFPMNVSVTVADAGETAVVVSAIDKNQQTKVPSESTYSSVNTSNILKNGNQENGELYQNVLPASDASILERQTAEKTIKIPKIEAMELDPCLLQLSGLSRKFKEETCEPSVSDGLRTSELYNKSNNELESDFQLVSSVGPLSAESDTTEAVEEKKLSKVCRRPADKNSDKKEKDGGMTGAKRKQKHYSAEEGEPKTKTRNSTSSKIAKREGSSRGAHSVTEANDSVSNDSRNLKSAVVGSGGGIVKKRKVETDIRDIVQGTRRRPFKRLSEDKEASSGLRIKKIMRRETDDKESLVEVQNLRKEIREAIRNRSANEIGNNILDPKLLAAFRTALAGQTAETKRPPPLDVKAKKALLQKGTVRENLTKKIYGTGGKRKRAWTRDCEIEFWKHRCSTVSKPEKVETLKSVLDLLRKGPEVVEIKKESSIEAQSSILSRLYVADASVFPRNNDIKPLSVQPTALVDSKESKVSIPYKNGGSETMKVYPNKSSDQSSRSGGSLPKESGSGSNNIKFDKKKWALEILARKNAALGNNSSKGQDNVVLKGNFPLLAKLPVEMWPSLAPSRHNKIPISVRQAQLHRITEHFLRKTNMPVSRPTGEIELAVADAINVEKAVADKSNSKLVYVNLCSQELLHRSDNVDSSITPDSESKLEPKAVTDDLPTSADFDVDEALRKAGLLSDSPPSSPQQYEADNVKEEDGPANVFEIDSQPELDIYGDFEYDLEDDDAFISTSAIKASKVQQEDTKIKLVFSTLDSDRSDSVWRFEDHEAPVVVTDDNLKVKSTCRSSIVDGAEDEVLGDCEELYGPDKEPLISKYPEIKLPDLVPENTVTEVKDEQGSNLGISVVNQSSGGEDLPKKLLEAVEGKDSQKDLPKISQETVEEKKKSDTDKKRQPDKRSSVFKKVEAYIKEHIRPLCKSGVITVDQYRWAVGKTTDKIMKYHSKDTNANFLIKEGEKVKKLAEQYVESAQKVENNK
uniref:uncharacterized protein At4g10930 n=1 Tax=Erigeron canadensis TaxID=72917 RepID=UPI001CB8E8DF|nr:uncharacterized protein At4g10930 [Erigeron canadensis]